MLTTRSVVLVFTVAMMVVGIGQVFGQGYPNKPIRIVTSEPGANNDFVSRIIAQGISGPLGQPVIVENRGGATSAGIVSRAPPDGYTLVVSTGSLWLSPFLQKTSYDPVRDFSPISLVAAQPNMLVLHPSLPVKSVNELIALAKTRPGELNYGSGGSGSGNHIAGELFKSLAGVDIVRINYKGAGQALNAVVTGQVQMMFSGLSNVGSLVKSGKVKALAVTSSRPSALAPSLPTVAASGLAGFDVQQYTGVWAPAKTPEAIINRLNQEIVRLLLNDDGAVKQKFLNFGIEAVGSSPGQFAATIRDEMARMGKVIKDGGITAE